MSSQVFPPELIYHILSYVPPSWHWGNLGWDSDRSRRNVANNVRWFLQLRLVSREFLIYHLSSIIAGENIKFIDTNIDAYQEHLMA
jgi:hypothetical protein